MTGDIDRTACGIVADLLRQGRLIHVVSTAMGAVALVLVLLPFDRASWRICLAASLVLCLAQTYLALRTSFDAALFRRLERGLPLDAFDAAMTALSLLPAEKAGRPLAQRITGARRLMRLQAWAVASQMACLVPPLVWLKP